MNVCMSGSVCLVRVWFVVQTFRCLFEALTSPKKASGHSGCGDIIVDPQISELGGGYTLKSRVNPNLGMREMRDQRLTCDTEVEITDC